MTECTICLLEYTDETKTNTKCNHMFHIECLDRWLQANNTCPLCRHILKPVTEISFQPFLDQPHFGSSVTEISFQPFLDQPHFGSTVTFMIPLFGDMMYNPIHVELPSIRQTLPVATGYRQ